MKNLEREESIANLLRYVLGREWDKRSEVLYWPPYIFAAMAFLLKKSGAYINVVRNWPPRGLSLKMWRREIIKIAEEWRYACEFFAATGKPSRKFPARIMELIEIIKEFQNNISIGQISSNAKLASVIIELLALCDEASKDIAKAKSVGSADGYESRFATLGFQLLLDFNTLVPAIPKTLATVLPKQHTPSGGLNFRSLSHHLAFHVGSDARASWVTGPIVRKVQNILLAPWPLSIKPSQFSEVPASKSRVAEEFGLFDFSLNSDGRVVSWLKERLHEARASMGEIHGIIFPECSLTAEQFKEILIMPEREGAYVIAGVLVREKTPRNEVWVGFSSYRETIVQSKHHRWKLDENQINMYGIGYYLDPKKSWWEHIEIKDRNVNFIDLGELTICCLVCEDLARQEPVAELVRAVGPDLVIALLADGPQLGHRWPGRYATVLADDPGSSVLTVNSLGMALLAKPPVGAFKSRCIALWKDGFGRSEEVTLPASAESAVICLRTCARPEFSADGREDGKENNAPQLVGVHYF